MIMHWRKWSRRRRIITITTLMAMLIMIVYVVVSAFIWHSFQSRLAVAMTDIEAVVSELQSQDLTPERLQKALDRMLQAEKISCQTPVGIMWQRQIIAKYNESVTQCQDLSLTIPAEAVSELRDYSMLDQRVAQIVRQLNSSLRQVTNYDFDAMITAWDQVRQDISQIAWDRDDDVRRLRNNLVQKATEVVQELRAVKTAHDAKDRQQFDEATTKLREAYQRFRQSQQTATQIMSQKTINCFGGK